MKKKFFTLPQKYRQNGVDGRLEELLGRQSKIERQMNNITRSLAGLNVASDEANKVNSMIENTSSLAENVSAKVRRLDEARVSHSLNPLPNERNQTRIYFFPLETCF